MSSNWASSWVGSRLSCSIVWVFFLWNLHTRTSKEVTEELCSSMSFWIVQVRTLHFLFEKQAGLPYWPFSISEKFSCSYIRVDLLNLIWLKSSQLRRRPCVHNASTFGSTCCAAVSVTIGLPTVATIVLRKNSYVKKKNTVARKINVSEDDHDDDWSKLAFIHCCRGSLICLRSSSFCQNGLNLLLYFIAQEPCSVNPSRELTVFPPRS